MVDRAFPGRDAGLRLSSSLPVVGSHPSRRLSCAPPGRRTSAMPRLGPRQHGHTSVASPLLAVKCVSSARTIESASGRRQTDRYRTPTLRRLTDRESTRSQVFLQPAALQGQEIGRPRRHPSSHSDWDRECRPPLSLHSQEAVQPLGGPNSGRPRIRLSPTAPSRAPLLVPRCQISGPGGQESITETIRRVAMLSALPIAHHNGIQGNPPRTAKIRGCSRHGVGPVS